MAKLEDGPLFIETAPGDGGVTRCDWRGQSTARRPADTLQPFFTELLEEVGEGGTIEMSFLELAYFNSSTVAALIKLIKQARSAGVKLVLVYAGDSIMHANSFESLRIFEKDDGLLELRPVGVRA